MVILLKRLLSKQDPINGKHTIAGHPQAPLKRIYTSMPMENYRSTFQLQMMQKHLTVIFLTLPNLFPTAQGQLKKHTGLAQDGAHG